MSCMGSLVCWVLHRAAWQGLNNTQGSKRKTGSGPCRPTRPETLFVAWLLLEKAQQVATGRREGRSPAFPPKLRSSCPGPPVCAAAPSTARTSCSAPKTQKTHSSHIWCPLRWWWAWVASRAPETKWLNVCLALCIFAQWISGNNLSLDFQNLNVNRGLLWRKYATKLQNYILFNTGTFMSCFALFFYVQT